MRTKNRYAMKISFPLFIIASFYGAFAAPVHSHRDKVISLPGAPLLPQFNLFAGYLNGSSNEEETPIFYVLAEAIRVDPSTAPLVVWFNGGPGGSSLYGCFLENGPYRLTAARDVLTYNEFSWNQYANVLYLESPLGVGFSQTNESDVTVNDREAAEINFHALKDFMIRVHPNYAGRDYYLSGQSYACVYVPYFARRLLREYAMRGMGNGRFKGFAIGDPTFTYQTSILAEAMLYLNHGLIERRLTKLVLNSWMKHQKGDELDEDDLEDIKKALFDDITENFIGWSSPIAYNFNDHCYTQALSWHLSEEDYHRPTDKKSMACDAKYGLESYMNRFDVQAALHVKNTRRWNVMNNQYSRKFSRDYDVLPVYNDIFRLVNGSSFRVLIYNGDMDMVKPATHAIESTANIAADNSLKEQDYDRAWRVYGDFAGIRTGYRNGNVSMDMLTVRGAGHSVPTDLPAQAFQMINNFLFTQENEEIDYSKPIRKHGNL